MHATNNLGLVTTVNECLSVYSISDNAVYNAIYNNTLPYRRSGDNYLLTWYDLYQRWGADFRDPHPFEAVRGDVDSVATSAELVEIYGLYDVRVVRKAIIGNRLKKVRQSGVVWLVDKQCAYDLWGYRL